MYEVSLKDEKEFSKLVAAKRWENIEEHWIELRGKKEQSERKNEFKKRAES